MARNYYSGRGKVLLADVVNGVPGPFRWVGNSPELTLGFETETLEHIESWSGQNVVDLRLLVSKTANVTLVLEEFSPKNLALQLFGDAVSLTGNTIVGESLAGGAITLAVGDIIRLNEPNVSALDVKDSLSASLTLDTDYKVSSAAHGTLEIIGDLAGYTGPFVADYTSGTGDAVRMLTEGLREKWVMVEGKNIADSDAATVTELYRVAFDPAEALAMVTDGNEVQRGTLNGSALLDATKANDPLLGNFGRVVLNLN